jgi:exonuclease III
MPDILHTHPTTHRQRARTYFIPNTIKLYHEYQHLATSFAPILKQDHPSHQQIILTLPHLYQYIRTQNHTPPPHMLYAIIITIDPSIDKCNNILAQPTTYNLYVEWTNILIGKLANLTNPPERHILKQHPYTKFVETHHDLLQTQNSVHKALYTFIHSQETPPTLPVTQRKFPFLPDKLISESLRCLETINEYSHPPPLPNVPTPTTTINTNTNNETNMITWNASSLNTALPNLQYLITHTQLNTAVITIQETKLTATKSTKYIQNLFPQYKLIFNNTHALTRCIQQRMPYTPGRGGLLTLIHHKYAFPGNITKIPTPTNISPYLQIIRINNHPLQPWLIIHMYMPTHLEDIRHIPNIQTTIMNQITLHQNHTYILCGDFNRDIALIGRHNDSHTTPPQDEDIQWKNFTTSISLEYIPTNTTFSRQGGNNYTSTSLIDGFYINSPNNSGYSSTTNTQMNLNSDHYPITLHIPHNTLIARTPPSNNSTQIRILNPIPPEKLEQFNIKFFEENTIQINVLTTILENNDSLTHTQWQNACSSLDAIIDKISLTIKETCSAELIPQHTNRTAQQGGFLPRKLAKIWKKI